MKPTIYQMVKEALKKKIEPKFIAYQFCVSVQSVEKIKELMIKQGDLLE